MTNIYIITNLINNKVYIGQTKRNVRTRFLEHKRDVHSALHEDMCKLGREFFTYKLLHICQDIYADQWERYYICKYDATNPSVGYNIVPGGTFKWIAGKENPSKTSEGKLRISKYNKEHSDTVLQGFKNYNNSRKFPVGMLDTEGKLLKVFDSLSDACSYLGKNFSGTARIKNVCDKFNKNGKRARFFGYSWTALDKGVQTIPKDGVRVEDELPSE